MNARRLMLLVNPLAQAGTYAAALDALPIVAYIARPDGTISYLSLSWETETGNPRRELIERGYETIIHPDDVSSAVAKWRAARATGETYGDEFRIRHGDGAYRWVLSRADPMRDGESVIGWFGTMTNIDDRKVAEAALAESESTYRAFSAAIPGVTWAADLAGALTSVGDAWVTIHGTPLEGALGVAWQEMVHPDDRAHTVDVWTRSLQTGEPLDVQLRLRVADGSYHWFLARGLPIANEQGAIVRWVGVNVDINDQRRADESREQFVRLVENSGDLISIANRAGYLTYINAAGRTMLGIGPDDEPRASRLIDFFVPEDREFVESQVHPAVERDGRWSGEVRLRNVRTGEPIPISYNAFALLNRSGSLAGYATVSRDLRAQHRVQAGLRVLADTGALMFGSLDVEQTLRNVAETVTKRFATFCVIDLVDDDGRVRRIASVHSDPGLAEALERTVAGRIVRDEHHVSRALREGATTFVAEVDAEWISGVVLASSHGDAQRLEARSMICVPLRANLEGAVSGALTFFTDSRAARGAYTSDDVEFAKEVGVRAGLAVNHARSYERERHIAATLQQAFLPTRLPESAGLRLFADYRPGNSEATIGGDWYDAFELEDGRLAITLGDVMGNGLIAAVTMGKLRQAMQSVAFVSAEPLAMLAAADRTVRTIAGEGYATAIAGIYDPVTREFAFASAGHPPLLLRHPDGRLEEFNPRGGPLIGLGSSATEIITLPLQAGSALVLFTDGLIEATHDVEEGMLRLGAGIADASVASAANPAKALVDHVLRGVAAVDDVAVVLAVALA